MKAYTRTVNLKLGLIVFAVLIAVTSLYYTNGLVNRLRDRERSGMEIWAGAREQVALTVPEGPFSAELQQLARMLREDSIGVSNAERTALTHALDWAIRRPDDAHMGFFFDVIREYHNDVPAIITDSLLRPVQWRNLSVPDTGVVTIADSQRVLQALEAMTRTYDPIPIESQSNDSSAVLKQFVYYDESDIIQELRVYPWLQLLFVSLFIVVGYLGFSYVRRNEQSSLWVGMAREAAHQLGTPISSLMGWLELLRQEDTDSEAQQRALGEMTNDVERLSRVAHRFNDIGSLPKLDMQPLAPVIAVTASYLRRRFPRHGIALHVDVPDSIYVPLNAQLFEWVIENLLKNALDAIEKKEGRIEITATPEGSRLHIDMSDNGKGIDRRHWKNVFRPGYSTKKRGWGLGLSLAKRIVEEYHGGSLTLVQSRPGKGTTFRIDLPIAAPGKV